MNDTSTSDPLLWEALPDLTLNIAQTAALCGISVRQLGYWTRQGYVLSQGRGARRTYGLESVRRVLAIRKAMDAGASLRQSLNQVAASEPVQAAVSEPAQVSASAPAVSAPTKGFSAALPPGEAEALSQNLKMLFENNRHTRDHAGGLAVKLGRHEDDVRAVAESLCMAGILSQSVCRGLTIFHRAGWEAAHVSEAV